MKTMQKKDYVAGYTNIGWFVKGVRDLLIYAMVEGKLWVGAGPFGIIFKPECLEAANRLGQVSPLKVDDDSLSTIMPDAIARFGGTGVPIVFDFLCTLCKGVGHEEQDEYAKLEGSVVTFLNPSFEQWETYCREVVTLRTPDGEELSTQIPEDAEPDYEELVNE